MHILINTSTWEVIPLNYEVTLKPKHINYHKSPGI